MSGRSRDQISTDITPGIVYQTFGSVQTEIRAEAEKLMTGLADFAPRPVIFAKVKIKEDADRASEQTFVVQGTMDVSGTLIRAEAAGPTATEGLRGVGHRLERRLRKLAERRQRATKRPPSTPPGSWRSGDLPTERPEFFERPVEQREVVRRKTFSPADRISVADAIFDLDVLDYRFYLFTDESDDKASIVYGDGDGLTLRKVDGSTPDRETHRPDIKFNETPASTISVSEAVSRLNQSDMSFVFFEDSSNGSASVLYRRYDGHYGLIVPYRLAV